MNRIQVVVHWSLGTADKQAHRFNDKVSVNLQLEKIERAGIVSRAKQDLSSNVPVVLSDLKLGI